ncbi:MAG: hypothetical protein ABIA04_02585 [Pseudomonadota bacterium]
MSDKLNELSVNFKDDSGEVLVKELKKEVLSKGAWSTVMFLYQDRSNSKAEFSAPKVSIRRYQKRGDDYFQRSKFNISSEKQAKLIVDNLKKWYEFQ